jgi:hypothetical protein
MAAGPAALDAGAVADSAAMPDRPDEDGDHLFQMIDLIWHKTQQSWRDDMPCHFDRAHWTSMAAESRAFLRALRECPDIVNAAERDTEY